MRRRNFKIIASIEGYTPIPGYDTYYAKEDGLIVSNRPQQLPRMLPGQIDREGYLLVGIYQGLKRVKRRVHRLVAITFIPNPENKPQVNHIDFNPMNNAVSNLVWSTSKEDALHKVAAGRQAKGAEHGTKIRVGYSKKKRA